jgi:hypothetical protein
VINLRTALTEEFPHISSVALKKQLLVPSTYLAKERAQDMQQQKQSSEIGLIAEYEMRIQLSKIAPDFNCFWPASRSTRRNL